MFNFKKLLIDPKIAASNVAEQEEFGRIQVATCVILLEVATSDDEISNEEKITISEILMRKFQLSQDAIDELMELAAEKREASVGLWQFTNLINETFSREEKMKILEATWEVIYADERLDKYEDYLIRRLSKLLRLHHEEMIAAKLKVRGKVVVS
ncbi:MAG: hypothetical protein GQ544_00150 [Candidatus Aminicenantes bacterium]|nr:hypothetical protein [Candidatus Aminicenantes bacterium]